MSRVIYMVFAILVALIGLAFHVRNSQQISVDYFIGSINLELSWLVVGTLVGGAVLGVLAMMSTVIRLRSEVRRLNRRNDKSTSELSSLRAVALKDAG